MAPQLLKSPHRAGVSVDTQLSKQDQINLGCVVVSKVLWEVRAPLTALLTNLPFF